MIPALRNAFIFACVFLFASSTFAQQPDPHTSPSAYAIWKQTLHSPSSASVMPAPPSSAARGGLLITYPGDGGWSVLDRNDDDFTGMLDLGFSYTLYGTTYNQVCVNNNGNVSFGPDDNSCYSSYDPEGFPSTDFVMVAPFWADVDTRCDACGLVYYKTITVDGTPAFVAHWEQVGFYSQHPELTNTFQVVIASAPVLLGDNNVCFGYGDMQWTTGDASDGDGGFGGFPAVVGANRGNGQDFFLYGSFDHEGVDYDGPSGAVDGVSHLDGQTICFNTAEGSGNVSPIASGFSNGEAFEINIGETWVQDFTFLSPEGDQTTTITVDAGGLANFSATAAAGNIAVATLTFQPDASQVGDHAVTLTATDDGSPALSTTVTIVLRVLDPTASEDDAQPDEASLAPAYPNPMRATTTLPFHLAVAGPVRLTVYDLLGHEVARLADAPMGAGDHTATWDGRDAVGHTLPGGLYLVRLDAGGRVTTQKLMRVR